VAASTADERALTLTAGEVGEGAVGEVRDPGTLHRQVYCGVVGAVETAHIRQILQDAVPAASTSPVPPSHGDGVMDGDREELGDLAVLGDDADVVRSAGDPTV
jgi:hypothetical protein